MQSDPCITVGAVDSTTFSIVCLNAFFVKTFFFIPIPQLLSPSPSSM